MTFAITVERSNGTAIGVGPVATATRWRRVRRLDQAGSVEATAPATDERTSLFTLRRYIRCYGQQAGARRELGLGIIDRVDIDTDNRTMAVSGGDLLRELAWRSVSFLELKTGPDAPIDVMDALDLIIADCNSQTDPDWTIDYTTYGSTVSATLGDATLTNVTNIENWVGREGAPIFGDVVDVGATVLSIDTAAATIEMSTGATATDIGSVVTRASVFYAFAGESVLQALAKVAELTGQHFRLGSGREIVWLHDMKPSSGVRAVIGADPIAAESNRDICLITSLSYMQDSSGVISHLHPWGSGNPRMGLANDNHDITPDPNATTRTAPDGYTLDLDNLVIRRDDAETDYGYSIRHYTFNDIGPTLEEDDPDYDAALVAARNQLFDAAIEYLRVNSYPLESYRLSIAKLDREVLPGQTVRVIYQDRVPVVNEVSGVTVAYRWVNIDAELLVLEATTEVTDAGIHTPGLVVATVDRWPTNDVQLLVAMKRQIEQAQSHRQ